MNVAQRLEEMGRSLGEVSAPVNILISGALKESLTTAFDLTPLGPCEIRGRREKVEIFVLNGPPMSG